MHLFINYKTNDYHEHRNYRLQRKDTRNEMFGEIRTMTNEKGETFFVGKDVAKALGYKNTSKAIQQHVDQEDKTTLPIWESGSN